MFNQTQKIFLALGVGVVSLFGASQVSAQQAYASGSSTITLMNGAAMSMGSEIAAPPGSAFDLGGGGPGVIGAQANVDPTLNGSLLDVNTTVLSELEVNAGTVVAAPAGSSFTAAAAAKLAPLAPATDLSDIVSIIRAGAGVDGLD